MKLLEKLKEGWSFQGLRRFHYFRDGQSLCGKYQGKARLSSGLDESECCSKCFEKLRREINKENRTLDRLKAKEVREDEKATKKTNAKEIK